MRKRTSRLCVERLEERDLLAVFAGGEIAATEIIDAPIDLGGVPQVTATNWVVTSNANTLSNGTLRYALTYASSGDTITFDASLNGKVISFSGTQFSITKNLSINASSLANGITLNMNGGSRAFSISSSATVNLNNITIRNAAASGDGGAINVGVGCRLNMVGCSVVNCTATGAGGGVFSQGTFNASLCTFQHCTAGKNGGGVCQAAGSVELSNCLIVENTGLNGGGLYTATGRMYVYQSTVARNTATGKGGGFCDATDNAAPASAFYNSIVVLNDSSDRYTRDVYTPDDQCETLAYYTLSSYVLWGGTEYAYQVDWSKPIFVDANGSNYHLAVNSQALDKGSLDYVTTSIDLDGNRRVSEGQPDLGAYETPTLDHKTQLSTPTIVTGTGVWHVSYGQNRHMIKWSANPLAAGYELQWSTDGVNWESVVLPQNTSAHIVSGLTYGSSVSYRVRTLGDARQYSNSAWSTIKTFAVCPMDLDGDDFIGPGDLAIISAAWFKNSDSADWGSYRYADIDGDSIIGPGDRAFLVSNWFGSSTDDLAWPKPYAEK